MTQSEFIFSGGFGFLAPLIALLIFALGILWFILPFAVFGTKARLDKIIEENLKLNQTLLQMTAEIKLLREDLSQSR